MYRDEKDDLGTFEDFNDDRKSESHSEEDMNFYPMSMNMHDHGSCPYMKEKMMPQMHQMGMMQEMPQMHSQMGGCCPSSCPMMQDFESSGSDDESSDMYRRRPYYYPYYDFHKHPYPPYNPYPMKPFMPWWMYHK